MLQCYIGETAMLSNDPLLVPLSGATMSLRSTEIDLVLRDGAVLVICEVKTRTSTRYGDPLEAVTEQKAARLRRLAARWLAGHDLRPSEVRIGANLRQMSVARRAVFGR